MKITPVDVAHKTFNKSIYGLDQKEVLNYLQAVADQLEILTKERNDLREKLRDKEIQISEYKERDQLLKNTLTTASQMSEKIKEDAEKKADLILQEAHLKATEIQRATNESLRKAYVEINDLKALRIQYESNMRALAHAHITLLDDSHKYMSMQGPAATMNEGTSTETTTSQLTSNMSSLSVDMV